jgi:hypothetical protein
MGIGNEVSYYICLPATLVLSMSVNFGDVRNLVIFEVSSLALVNKLPIDFYGMYSAGIGMCGLLGSLIYE